MKAVVSITGA